jgi:branched-chain amino acid transport system substrate-binding protein
VLALGQATDMQPEFVAVWTRAGKEPVKQDVKGTGYGFTTELRLDAKETTLPTTCNMDRPN